MNGLDDNSSVQLPENGYFTPQNHKSKLLRNTIVVTVFAISIVVITVFLFFKGNFRSSKNLNSPQKSSKTIVSSPTPITQSVSITNAKIYPLPSISPRADPLPTGQNMHYVGDIHKDENGNPISYAYPALYINVIGTDKIGLIDSIGKEYRKSYMEELSGDPNHTPRVPESATVYSVGAPGASMILSLQEELVLHIGPETDFPGSVEIYYGFGSVETAEFLLTYHDLDLSEGLKMRITGKEITSFVSEKTGAFVEPTAVQYGQIDLVAPKITITDRIEGSERIVTIEAIDDAGIKSTTYSTDGKQYQPYVGPITLPLDNKAIYVLSNDINGNRNMNDKSFVDEPVIVLYAHVLNKSLPAKVQFVEHVLSNNRPLEISLDFGDGSPISDMKFITTHEYEQYGVYHPKMIVTDSKGLKSFATIELKLEP